MSQIRIGAALGVVAVAAACHDPRLEVAVKVPAGWSADVRDVVIEVLQPPPGETLPCDKLAFGLVAPDVERLAKLREVALPGSGSGPIGELDRQLRHVFLARGVGGDGAHLLSGCAELDPFRSDVEVLIELEPVVTIGVPAATFFAAPAGRPPPLPAPISVELLDAHKRAAAGATLRWTATGAGAKGKAASGELPADASGKVRLQPALPEAAGPVAIDLRARWATMVRVPGFVHPPIVELTVSKDGAAVDYQIGRLGAAGAPALTALLLEQGQARLRVCTLAGTGSSCPTDRDLVLPGAGKLARLHGGDRDRLLLVTAQSALVIDGSTLSAPVAHGRQGPPASLVPAGPCPDPIQAAASFADGNLLFAADASASPLDAAERLVAGGCVSSKDGGLHRVLVSLAPGGAVTVDVPARAQRFLWPGASLGVGFLPPQGGRRLMLSARQSIDELVVARGQLDLDGAPTIRSLEHDLVPAPPLETGGGDLDGDGAIDVAGLLTARGADGGESHLLWIASSSAVDGRRVTGVVPLTGFNLCAPRLWVADANADRVDDIVVTDTATCVSGPKSARPPARALVLLMGTPL